MQPHRHPDVAAEVGAAQARVITSPDEFAAAVALLDTLEEAAGVPLVDEAERHRLGQQGVGGAGGNHEHWHALLSGPANAPPDGYAGILLLPGSTEVVGDVAVARDRPCGDPLEALLIALGGLAVAHGASHALVWVRHAGVNDLACAQRVGWTPDRRLDVLAFDVRPGDDPPQVDPTAGNAGQAAVLPDGLRLRAWAGPDDDEQVAQLLAAAYAETPEAGWTAADVATRRALPWFDAADLLLAVDDDDSVMGVHWTKRRDATTGEVYNLAVHPQAQGTGLGRALLHVGVDHLANHGATTVLLWVDRDNHAAAQLYRRFGFELAWTDLALRLRSGQSPSVDDSRRVPGGTTL